jgi:hypothetical protein
LSNLPKPWDPQVLKFVAVLIPVFARNLPQGTSKTAEFPAFQATGKNETQHLQITSSVHNIRLFTGFSAQL